MSGRNRRGGGTDVQTRASGEGVTRRQLLAAGGGIVGAAAGVGLLQTQPTTAARAAVRRSTSLDKGPTMYMLAVGKNQGVFVGDGLGGGSKQHFMKLLEYRFSVESPVDRNSGGFTGKITHHALTIAKEIGPSTPQFIQALNTGEVLSAVTLQFFVPKGSSGEVTMSYQMVLTNSHVVSVNQFIAELDTLSSPTALGAGDVMEEIALTYQLAAIEWVPTHKTTEIVWYP